MWLVWSKVTFCFLVISSVVTNSKRTMCSKLLIDIAIPPCLTDDEEEYSENEEQMTDIDEDSYHVKEKKDNYEDLDDKEDVKDHYEDSDAEIDDHCITYTMEVNDEVLDPIPIPAVAKV